MSEIKNKIITISGEPVSGKSTVVKMLKEKYEQMGYRVHLVITGHVFRDRIIKEYIKMYPDRTDANLADIQEDETFAEKRAEIDGAVDGWIAEMGEKINSEERTKDVYIIDSRLAWHNIPNSYAVRLTVDEKIAGQRVLADKSRGTEDSYDTLEDAIQKTRQRKLGEIERYKKRYGVDLANQENYDLIVDTSYSNTEELAGIIIKGEESYREGIYYPKTWASPVHFFSEQRERDTNSGRVKEIIKSINEKGYSLLEGTVSIVENEGVKILVAGNHRTCAALSSGMSLMPYSVVAKDDEYTRDLAETIYEDPTLERVYVWAEIIRYYGGNVGNIEKLKEFEVRDLLGIDKVPRLRKRLGLDKAKEGQDR